MTFMTFTPDYTLITPWNATKARNEDLTVINDFNDIYDLFYRTGLLRIFDSI